VVRVGLIVGTMRVVGIMSTPCPFHGDDASPSHFEPSNLLQLHTHTPLTTSPNPADLTALQSEPGHPRTHTTGNIGSSNRGGQGGGRGQIPPSGIRPAAIDRPILKLLRRIAGKGLDRSDRSDRLDRLDRLDRPKVLFSNTYPKSLPSNDLRQPEDTG
jgi:hypothetical protein